MGQRGGRPSRTTQKLSSNQSAFSRSSISTMMKVASILIIVLLFHFVSSQTEKSEEDDSRDITENVLPSSSTAKPDDKKSNFSEDRFSKLFQPRRPSRPKLISPRFVSKPKPTLPSFIKNTPPIIKVQPSDFNNVNQRPTHGTTSTTKSPRTSSRTQNQSRNNQSSNRNVRNQQTSSSTTESPSRRKFGANIPTTRRNSTSTNPFKKG